VSKVYDNEPLTTRTGFGFWSKIHGSTSRRRETKAEAVGEPHRRTC